MASSCPQGLQGCRDCFPRASKIVDSEVLESQGWVFTKSSTEILDEHCATELIGGALSAVYKATLRLPGSPAQLCAVKRLKAGMVRNAEERYTEQNYREMCILEMLAETCDDSHPGRLLFVPYLGGYEQDDAIHLVMDYMPQGDLLHYLDIPWGEEDTQIVAKQVLSALSFLHKEYIAHRCINAENIFPLLSHDGTLHIKVGDFGAAKQASPDSGEKFMTRLGIPESTAPEIFLNTAVEYTPKVDIFSLGTLIFKILTAKKLFPTAKDYFNAYHAGGGNHQVSEALNNKTSDEVKALIASMVEFEPEARPSANDALDHSWFLAESRVITPELQEHFRTVLGKSKEGMKRTLDKTEETEKRVSEVADRLSRLLRRETITA